MRTKSKNSLKIELKRVRKRQNPHVFNIQDHKRKLKLKKSFWYRLKLKKLE